LKGSLNIWQNAHDIVYHALVIASFINIAHEEEILLLKGFSTK
jgi:hypothetical protein